MTDDQTIQIPTLDLNQLTVLSVLGRGGRGVVFLIRSNGELLALKTILKLPDCGECKQVKFELEVLRLTQHSLLPKLRGVVSTDKIVGFAIDYCPGGDLNQLQKKQTERMFSDDVIRFYAAELVLALDYLHQLGIVYRDLKPENIMIQENGHIMLIDFDLSTKLTPKPKSSNSQPPQTTPFPNSDPNNTTRIHPESIYNNSESNSVSKSNSFVGTEEYIAPEMLTGTGHSFSIDWWCYGVVLHEMLYGKTPFKGVNRKETFNNILSKSPELVGEPTALKDLIGKLLVKDPLRRLTADQIKGHDFFTGVDWDGILYVDRPPFVPAPLDEMEGMGVNKIDVEGFVQRVFKVDDDVREVDEFKKF